MTRNSTSSATGFSTQDDEHAAIAYRAAMKIWLNGHFVDRDNAKVSVFDAGFQQQENGAAT